MNSGVRRQLNTFDQPVHQQFMNFFILDVDGYSALTWKRVI